VGHRKQPKTGGVTPEIPERPREKGGDHFLCTGDFKGPDRPTFDFAGKIKKTPAMIKEK